MKNAKSLTYRSQPLLLVLVAGLFSQGCQIFSTEEAYARTPVDSVQFKTLPPSKILLTEGEGPYFDKADNLFMRLFNYIKDHDVAMTIPVEARMEKASMTFYVEGEDALRVLKDRGNVKVLNVPGRDVVSLGVRGSYTEKNFKEAKDQLVNWLSRQDRYESIGEPYAVFWNGPFMPGFMKRFEVHIPVRLMEEKDQEASVEVARK
jgi:DNA gyrase inhibitor GyrI